MFLPFVGILVWYCEMLTEAYDGLVHCSERKANALLFCFEFFFFAKIFALFASRVC